MRTLPFGRGNCLALIVLLVVLAASCGNKGPAESLGAAPPAITSHNPVQEKSIIAEENPGSPLQPQLIRVVRTPLPVYEKPEASAKILAQCGDNALLKYLFQRTNPVDEQFGKDLIPGQWFFVRADNPRAEGWIFVSAQLGVKNVDWVVGEALQKRVIKEGWNIAHLDRWSNEEIEQAIEIQGVPTSAGKYSGYYGFSRSEEQVDVMDGPFHVVAEQGEEKIEIDGEYATGMPVGDFIAVRYRGDDRETIALEYDGRSISCGGRKYTRSVKARQEDEKYDYECSFEFSDFGR